MAIVLPDELNKRYRGDAYIARMPFLLNSHLDADSALDRLSDRAVAPNDVFLGIPGFRSLDMLAVTGSNQGHGYAQAVLFDVNMTQIKAMNAVLHMIRHSNDADEFIHQFAEQYMKWIGTLPREYHTKRSTEDQDYFSVLGRSAQPETVDELRRQLEDEQANPYSWLFASNFRKIKAMVENGNIATAIMDLKDEKRVDVLRGWMKAQKARTGDIYTSSSILFMAPDRHFTYYSKVKTDDAHHYLSNLLALTDDESRILYSAPTPAGPGHGNNEFRLSLANREAFARLLAEWNAEPPVPALEKRYQYLFQAGRTGFQIGSLDGDVPQGKAMLELIAENRDLRPDETTKLRRALTMAGLELTAAQDPNGNISFYVSELNLSDPNFFKNTAAVVRAAMPVDRTR